MNSQSPIPHVVPHNEIARRYAPEQSTKRSGAAGVLTSTLGPRSFTQGRRAWPLRESLDLVLVRSGQALRPKRTTALGKHGESNVARGGTPQRWSQRSPARGPIVV